MSLPPRDKLYKRLSAIVDEVGPSVLTMKVLRNMLGQEFSMDFAPHQELLNELVERKLAAPCDKPPVKTARPVVVAVPSSSGSFPSNTKRKFKTKKKGKKAAKPVTAGEGVSALVVPRQLPALLAVLNASCGSSNAATVNSSTNTDLMSQSCSLQSLVALCKFCVC